MARNLARDGFSVRAWNRTREKAEPLARDGADVVDTPADAAPGASVVITMLVDTPAVLDSMDGDQSAAERPLTWVQMSTIGPDGSERCAQLAERTGIEYVDAPVLGTKQPAEQGELVILASGTDEQISELGPMFGAIGKRTMNVGPAGAGSRLKVVINSWLVTVVEGAAETIALAQGSGVDPNQFLEALAGGPLDLPYLQLKARAMIDGSCRPRPSVSRSPRRTRISREISRAAPASSCRSSRASASASGRRAGQWREGHRCDVSDLCRCDAARALAAHSHPAGAEARGWRAPRRRACASDLCARCRTRSSSRSRRTRRRPRAPRTRCPAPSG